MRMLLCCYISISLSTSLLSTADQIASETHQVDTCDNVSHVRVAMASEDSTAEIPAVTNLLQHLQSDIDDHTFRSCYTISYTELYHLLRILVFLTVDAIFPT